MLSMALRGTPIEDVTTPPSIYPIASLIPALFPELSFDFHGLALAFF
jgi:hypothetical protein